jgi:pilus assembly protein CpaC
LEGKIMNAHPDDSRRFGHGPWSIVIALTIALALGAAHPQIAAAKGAVTSTQIAIDIDKAQLVHLPEAAVNVFIANPDIADLQSPNNTSFIVFGKKVGNTTAYATTDAGKVTRYDIAVQRPTEQIGEQLQAAVPGARVQVTSLPNGLSISGVVASPGDAEKLKAAAKQFLGDKENLIFNVEIKSSIQVNLQVRVAEISKSVTKNFGFNWSAILNNGTIAIGLLTGRPPVAAFGDFIRSGSPNNFDSIGAGYHSKGGDVNVSSLLDALQNEGLVSILAEPNLTALSGETAKFLAGGEFPIPVSEGNQQIAIEFKQFGVSVDFTPTVLDTNRMSIKVKPSVSELSTNGAVTIDSIQVPALEVRSADTTVELASGQSFAIAGLYQNNASNQNQQLPWLGDIPILGALFRSTNFQRNESELVIIVTPYIVKPAERDAELHLPSDGLVFANDLEQLFLGRLTQAPGTHDGPAPGAHLSGPAGFLME